MNKLVITVDDLAPVHGWGFRDQYIERIFTLIEDFGCKFTLFIVPNLKHPELANVPADLRLHPDFLKDLEFYKYKNNLELAAHGYDHYLSLTDGREFSLTNRDSIKSKIIASLEIFNSVGIHPTIFKAPGWAFPEQHMDLLNNYFKHVAVNIMGTKPIHNLLPHTQAINEEINPEQDNILTAHINGGPVGSNKNAFTQENYEKLRKLLSENKFEFMTLSEYAKSYLS